MIMTTKTKPDGAEIGERFNEQAQLIVDSEDLKYSLDFYAISPDGGRERFVIHDAKSIPALLTAIDELKTSLIEFGYNLASGGAGGGEPVKMCPVHNVPYQRNEKNGDVWYSHPMGGGKFCREERKK